MKHIYQITIDPSCGSTVDQTAEEAAQLMRASDIDLCFIVHNEKRYQVILQPSFVTKLTKEPSELK